MVILLFSMQLWSTWGGGWGGGGRGIPIRWDSSSRWDNVPRAGPRASLHIWGRALFRVWLEKNKEYKPLTQRSLGAPHVPGFLPSSFPLSSFSTQTVRTHREQGPSRAPGPIEAQQTPGACPRIVGRSRRWGWDRNGLSCLSFPKVLVLERSNQMRGYW